MVYFEGYPALPALKTEGMARLIDQLVHHMLFLSLRLDTHHSAMIREFFHVLTIHLISADISDAEQRKGHLNDDNRLGEDLGGLRGLMASFSGPLIVLSLQASEESQKLHLGLLLR